MRLGNSAMVRCFLCYFRSEGQVTYWIFGFNGRIVRKFAHIGLESSCGGGHADKFGKKAASNQSNLEVYIVRYKQKEIVVREEKNLLFSIWRYV